MNKRFRAIITSLTIVLCCCIIISILYSKQIEKTVIKSHNNIMHKKTPQYHFAVILHDLDDSYWREIQEGVNEASKDMSIAVEINSSEKINDLNSTLKYLDIAINSNVDGIITHVFNDNNFINLVNKAVEKGIPVITISEDIGESKRQTFVGTNNFELGSNAGKLAVEASKGKGKIAIIYEDLSQNNVTSNVNNNIKIDGFKNYTKDYPDIEIETIQSSKSGILGAENLTHKIINKFPDADVIVCTSSKDTIGAAQLVVDLNQVGDISIIGYGKSPEILRYIEKGVIYGTVVPDPLSIGYKSVEALVAIKKEDRTSSCVNTDVKVVTNMNLREYKKSLEKRKE